MKFSGTFKNLQYFAPLILTIFLILGLFSFLNSLLINFLYINFVVLLVIFIESLRLSFNLIEIVKLNLILFLGIILFGLGSISKIFGFSKNLKAIYTYR